MTVLEVVDQGRLRTLRLNRPERKNALNGELLRGLEQSVREAMDDRDVWAIAIIGNGKAFCSGVDIADPSMFTPAPASRDTDVRDAGYVSKLMRVDCEKPIVAGVNGVAVGAGVAIALNADIRIAAPSARFHPGYARVGLSPDLGLSWTLPRAVGYERAMRFLLEQRMVGADEALRLGMVSEVVEHDDDLDARILEYGTMLANVAPMAARQTKRLLAHADALVDLRDHLALEIELVLPALRSKDGKEAIRALLAGEQPTFTGE